jgi:hypothetical protein
VGSSPTQAAPASWQASTVTDMNYMFIIASVHKFPAVKTGRQGEFGAGSWHGSKQLQGLASKGGTEENGGTAEWDGYL